VLFALISSTVLFISSVGILSLGSRQALPLVNYERVSAPAALHTWLGIGLLVLSLVVGFLGAVLASLHGSASMLEAALPLVTLVGLIAIAFGAMRFYAQA